MSSKHLHIDENYIILDTIELQNQGYTDIHFMGHHLTGGTESTLPHNECFFGTKDSNNNPNFNNSNANDSDSDSDSNHSNDSNNDLNESKPIYYLECDLDC
ncbi:hypothetical protein ACWIX0_13795, partial [Helicobacter sp. T3_23-1059]